MMQRLFDLLRLKDPLRRRLFIFGLVPALVLLYVGASGITPVAVVEPDYYPEGLTAENITVRLYNADEQAPAEKASVADVGGEEYIPDPAADITIPVKIESRSRATLIVNGVTIYENASLLINGVTYTPVAPFLAACKCTSKISAEADGYVLTSNGRAVGSFDIAFISDSTLYAPVRSLVTLFGGEAVWNAETSVATVTAGSKIASGDSFYDEEDLAWLSKIICAESGSEPFFGKIAVGNVVLNRVESPSFPSTVYDVIFSGDGHQFTPVKTGGINNTPNYDSILAAKVCLEGLRFDGNPLYFINIEAAGNLWMVYNCEYVFGIGQHTFYTA